MNNLRYMFSKYFIFYNKKNFKLCKNTNEGKNIINKNKQDI